jgi:ABC-type Na+ transport system ATPase subunit NatA
MEEAENICDRVILLNKGRVIATGTPKQILKETNTNNLRDAFFALIGDDKNE